MKIIEVRFGDRLTKLEIPGHVDSYDAIAYLEDFSEVGLYQNRGQPNLFYSHRGLVVDKEVWTL